MTIGHGEKYFELRHGITGNDIAVYEKCFAEAFAAIAHAIQDAIRSGRTKLSTKEIDGGDIELTSSGTVTVSGITFRQEEKPDATPAPATVSDNDAAPVEPIPFHKRDFRHHWQSMDVRHTNRLWHIDQHEYSSGSDNGYRCKRI